jgi:sulfatase modifying factor 1
MFAARRRLSVDLVPARKGSVADLCGAGAVAAVGPVGLCARFIHSRPMTNLPALDLACGCGVPQGRTAPLPAEPPRIPALSAAARPSRLVEIPAAEALVGTRRPLLPQDGEAPLRRERLKPFAIDPHAVTNHWFHQFVTATRYVTDAERFGWSFVFHLFVRGGIEGTQGVAGAEWWRRIDGADWRRPEGPGSGIDDRMDHPVVQVSLNDARAFAAWAGGRLPTEAEWEHAARGGLGDVRYPWGDRDPDDREFMPCNIWQGEFPMRNTGGDGWLSTCPVNAFEANGYGLHNMCGNTWEWCEQPFRIRSVKRLARDADRAAAGQNLRLTKGGSFLCHSSYCHRYRIAARSGNTADSSTGHIGFRLVFDARA